MVLFASSMRKYPVSLAIAWALALESVLAQEGTGTAVAGTNPNYSCDPTVCVLPKCYCANGSPPGGLSPRSIPQFITLTFDDAVDSVLEPVIQSMIDGPLNPNGCPISSTFFVSTQWNDYWAVQRLYSKGHEIATHTMNHIGSPPIEEIVGAQTALNRYAGVPKSKLLGFRHPYLLYSTQSFQNLASAGTFLYESSMSMDGSINLWPYTLDNGPAISCVTGDCSGNFKFPGLWSLPMANLNNQDGSINTSMDPMANSTSPLTSDEILALLQYNFLSHYNGQRTPMGLFIHATPALPAIEPQRLVAYVAFIQWTLQNYPDVYWINNQQLLAWMQSPSDIAGSLKNPALGCLFPARDPSNVEICDGIDNKGDGNIDVGLVESCQYPDQNAYFSSCFGCPSKAPNVSDANPATSSTRFPIPDAGCPNAGTWDPVAGQCVSLARPIIVRAAVSTSPGSGNSSSAPGSGSSSSTIAMAVLGHLFLVGC
ncbi:uncharacterized protein BJ171DRAFT_558765 [Polychytrium aggregatum]|uniref:uncharacterized protein n=1 Tax=Polychytrium aggregatum TaxID=110093 RepID=UPI0022FDBEBE|nr:uncharacterized protein BJ171DRAFT_558765 [Polychytrium aggregatum]KAI9204001.1 hypothetical protein BJ171DRAFT_558765 [Polychytrium aggregatum]